MADQIEMTACGIVQRLQSAGFTAYFAGGCVRDRLLGKTPVDYDIATSARPEEVQKLFPRTVAVGAQFGVIVVVEKSLEFQVASFRADGIYIDGRHPTDVTFSTPQQDAERRDFTINGMFRDPVADEIIDFVNGRADLASGILKAIGNAADRFREDRLRMLRAVRFAATLGFEIEEQTWQALRENAAEIKVVSAERIREELTRIFVSPNRVRGFDLLDASGLLQVVLPEIEALKGCEQPPQFHPEGDVFVHTRKMLELLPQEVSVPLVYSVLLHDIGKPATFSYHPEEDRIRFSGHDKVGAEMATRVMERLRFSRDEIDATVEAVDQHMVFKDVQKMRVSRLKRFMSRPHFDDEMALHKVDCASSHGFLDNYDFLLTKKEEFSHEPLIPPPILRGTDLLELGWKPGPNIGRILEAVQTRQLEGTLTTHDQALEWVKSEFTPGSNFPMEKQNITSENP
ncbi:MAG: CCA tRNA nucleotidyltransferase [Chthoniobacteraceae bacterium]